MGSVVQPLKILYVHEEVREEFLSKFTKAVDALQLGMPWDNTLLTPLPEPNKPNYIQELIDDAKAKGAKMLNPRGGRAHRKFYFPCCLISCHT